MNKILIIISLALLLPIKMGYAADGTKITPTGMYQGLVEVPIPDEIKPLIKTYVESLLANDHEAHRLTWHPALRACVTPDNEDYFHHEVDKFMSILDKLGVADEYRISQFFEVPDNFTDQFDDVFDARGQYMAVEPTYLMVVDVGKEGTYVDETQGLSVSYPGMALIFNVVQDEDNVFYANNIPCKK